MNQQALILQKLQSLTSALSAEQTVFSQQVRPGMPRTEAHVAPTIAERLSQADARRTGAHTLNALYELEHTTEQPSLANISDALTRLQSIYSSIHTRQTCPEVSPLQDIAAVKYKTRICRNWLAGHCDFGPVCTFAHGQAELRGSAPVPSKPMPRRDLGVSINATPQLIQQASTIASLAGQMDPPKVFDSPQTGRPQVLIDLAFFRALLETVSQIHSQMLETPKVGFNLTGANFNRNY
jgi:hypothetical protein